MKKFYYIIVVIFLSLNTSFAQRAATHTLSNFNVNTSTNKFSFDIYSQRTGATTIRVGLTSYYIDYNNSALSSPLISNVNSKYTTGSATGDYYPMTVQIALGKIAVTINYDIDGVLLGDGTEDLLRQPDPWENLFAQ